MFWLNRNRILVLISFVLLISSLAGARSRRTQRLQTGNWGGLHIRMDVGPGSATIDYDCADGTIRGPLTIDRKGNFTWHGAHHQRHGGPIRVGEESEGLPAIYSGSVKGDTMKLTVKLANTGEVISTYTLKRGNEGRVTKCY